MSTLDSQLLKIYYYGLCTRPDNGRARPPHSARARARTRVVFGRLEEREIPNIVHAACVWATMLFCRVRAPCDGTRRDRALSCRAFYLYLYLFTPDAIGCLAPFSCGHYSRLRCGE